MVEHDHRCEHGSGVPEIDAAQQSYERNWPDRCWYQADDVHRRVYIEVEVLKMVEAMREQAAGSGET